MMDSPKFYLIADASIICSYLVSKWIDAFDRLPGFQGVIVKEDRPSSELLKARQDFHDRYFPLNDRTIGNSQKIVDLDREIADLYPSCDRTEQSMLKLFGVARYSTTGHEKTIFLGKNLNGKGAKNWLANVAQKSPPYIFVCATQILKSWWIESTNSQIFNCHSAVLPFARGMYAIENMAFKGNVQQFKNAAGATIHYLDEGVDTGAILRAQRIVNPFQFDSIWDLKAYSYLLGFNLFVKTAREILTDRETIPAGIVPDPQLQGPNFLIKDFTPEKQKQAESAYLLMKSSLARRSDP